MHCYVLLVVPRSLIKDIFSILWYLILTSSFCEYTQDEAAKSEQMDEGVVDQMEPDFPETQSPVKSHDSEDEFFRWSQYKSEL